MNNKSKYQEKLFLEADEFLIDELSQGFVANLILTDSISDDYLILSNKRVYYSGVNYGNVGGLKLDRYKCKIVIPLDKVCSFGTTVISKIFVLIISILVSLSLFIIALTSHGIHDEIKAFETGLAFFVFIFGLIIYFVSKKKYLIIKTFSDTIIIDFKLYKEASIYDFIKSLGKATSMYCNTKMDKKPNIETRSNNYVTKQNQNTLVSEDKAHDLNKIIPSYETATKGTGKVCEKCGIKISLFMQKYGFQGKTYCSSCFSDMVE